MSQSVQTFRWLLLTNVNFQQKNKSCSKRVSMNFNGMNVIRTLLRRPHKRCNQDKSWPRTRPTIDKTKKKHDEIVRSIKKIKQNN